MALIYIFLVLFGSIAGKPDGTGCDVNIEIYPKKTVALLDETVTITCDVVTDVNELLQMSISKDGYEPFVIMGQGSGNITYGTNNSQRFQAKGEMDKNAARKYLSVALMHPTDEDSCTFTCVALFLDKLSVIRHCRASSNLVVETDLDNKKLQIIITYLMTRVSSLEKGRRKLWHWITNMSETDHAMEKKMIDNEEKTAKAIKDKDLEMTKKIIDSGEKTAMEIQAIKDKDISMTKSMTEMEENTFKEIKALKDRDMSMTKSMTEMEENTFKEIKALKDRDLDMTKKIIDSEEETAMEIQAIKDKDMSMTKSMTEMEENTFKYIKALKDRDLEMTKKITDSEEKTAMEIQAIKDKDMSMTKSMTEMEENTFKEIKALKDRDLPRNKTMTEMEENIFKEINALKEKVFFKSAFFVTSKDNDLLVERKETIVLPDVDVNEGNGYNKTSGIFTAPVDGLYGFHLVAAVRQSKDCQLEIGLRRNNIHMAGLVLNATYSIEQSSIFCATVLSSGDTVNLKSYREHKCVLVFHQYTTFAGYLITPF